MTTQSTPTDIAAQVRDYAAYAATDTHDPAFNVRDLRRAFRRDGVGASVGDYLRAVAALVDTGDLVVNASGEFEAANPELTASDAALVDAVENGSPAEATAAQAELEAREAEALADVARQEPAADAEPTISDLRAALADTLADTHPGDGWAMPSADVARLQAAARALLNALDTAD